MDIKRWLNQLNLPQYEEIFQDYDDVQDILQLGEYDFYKMGVKNGAHRANIVSSLDKLRYKMNQKESRPYLDQPGQRRRSTAFAEYGDSPNFSTKSQLVKSAQTSTSLVNITRMDLQPQSKELEAQLRRQLEWELSQDGRLLESHAWYHGPIPRSHAESLLKSDGDFLIRDSSTGQVGDLVLSCFWRGSHLHFIINKVIVQPHTVYESIQYRLECEPFHSISDLVTCYVGSGKAVTAATGARIIAPVNRSLPLSAYSTRFFRRTSLVGQYATLPSKGSMMSETPRSPLRIQADYSSPAFSTHSLPRPISVDRRKLSRAPSDPSINAPQTQAESPAAPAKPSRIPSQIYPCLEDLSEDSSLVTDIGAAQHSADAGNDPATPTDQPAEESNLEGQKPESDQPEMTDENAAQFSTFPRRRNAKKYPKKPSPEKRHSFSGCQDPSLPVEITFDPPERKEASDQETDDASSVELTDNDKTPTNPVSTTFFPPVESRCCSMYDPDNFQTILLPAIDNKPLDMKTLEMLATLFEENSVKTLALHLLHGDLDVLGGLNGIDNALPRFQKHYEQYVGLTSGIELCTLPHGQQLRNDLLERTLCLKLLVAVTILTCSAPEDRAAMLNQWIEIAIESQMALGNMYGFSGLLLGLSMPQIQRLDSTWHLLRQRHTQTAYTFEARLKPLIKLIAAGTNPHATQPNCTVPDLHSAILVWEPTLDSLMSDDGISILGLNYHLLNCGPDFGLDVLSNHLNLVRSWSVNLPLYMRNARIVLENARLDEVLLDVFRTEFQMKFLWGSRGATSESPQRHSKFEQVLYALSERCEPS